MDAERYRGMTIEELLEEIEAAWERLMTTMTAHPIERYTAVQDPAGWTPLDHMAHITAWERSVLFPLMGRPRHEGLGVPEAAYWSDDEQANNFDPLNEVIRQQTAGEDYREVMERALREHQALVNTVDASHLDELWQAIRELCPDQRERHREVPFIAVLMADTAEHYEEHRGYIHILIDQE